MWWWYYGQQLAFQTNMTILLWGDGNESILLLLINSIPYIYGIHHWRILWSSYRKFLRWFWTHGHWIPFRRSNRLSLQVMSSYIYIHIYIFIYIYMSSYIYIDKFTDAFHSYTRKHTKKISCLFSAKTIRRSWHKTEKCWKPFKYASIIFS